MQFTITLLPASLSLIHIPRRYLGRCIPALLRQIFLTHAFFNITSNDLEITVFTQHHQDFVKAIGPTLPEGVEINQKWCVLQVDSHSASNNQLDDSGTRVHDLSLPLASAGISILYQASYSSDFLFVQESRLDDALSLLGDAGFHLYSDDLEKLTAQAYTPSPPLSPISEEHISLERGSSPPSSGAVLTRTRSGTTTSIESLISEADQAGGVSEARRTPSPITGRVELLRNSLVCVGLSDTDAEVWTLKVIRLIVAPDLIQSEHKPEETMPYGKFPSTPPATDFQGNDEWIETDPLGGDPTNASSHPPFFSFTRSPDGSSLITDVSALSNLFAPSERHMLQYGGEIEAEERRKRSEGHFNENCHNDNDDSDDSEAILKCLQIDLEKFGLGKHGLIHRFSRVLRDHHINHLYTSTYYTANILVDKKHAGAALALLGAC